MGATNVVSIGHTLTVGRLQVVEEKMEMMDLQNQNQQILCNMLPTHVANYFIEKTTSTGVVTTTIVCVLSSSINIQLSRNCRIL